MPDIADGRLLMIKMYPRVLVPEMSLDKWKYCHEIPALIDFKLAAVSASNCLHRNGHWKEQNSSKANTSQKVHCHCQILGSERGCCSREGSQIVKKSND